MISFKKFISGFESKCAVFEYDNCLAFIGLPEFHFKNNYESKFEIFFEDVQCSR